MRSISRLLILIASWGVLVHAQSPNATIAGRVVDPGNAVIADAEVEVINLYTNIHYTGQTNREGSFLITSLPPAPYRIEVRRSGFKTVIREDVVLRVQDVVALNFTLPIGSVTENVTVIGGAPLLETESAAVGTVVDRQFVENIPLNGRSFQSLISLTPGVVTAPATGRANATGQLSINGQRPGANNFIVDGVSANFGASAGTFGGPYSSGNLPGLTALDTTQSLVSVDALQEFKVQTSSYSAEYGRQPGGQISIVTRSGGNSFHGSLFEYLRNDLFDANDWFADNTGQRKPAERQNDFGGTLGGPVLIPSLYNGRDKTFFFFSYEGLRLSQPQFGLFNVPTVALRQQAPAAMQPILNAFPLPNGRDLGNGLAELNASYSNPSNLDSTSIRLDHTISSRLTIFGRYNHSPSETAARLAGGNLALIQPQIVNTQTMTVGVTASVTPRLNNDFRANYSGSGAYFASRLDNIDGAIPPPTTALIPSQYQSSTSQAAVIFLFPGRTSSGVITAGFSGNFVTSQKQLNFVDNVTFSIGAHRLTMGVDYRRLRPVSSFASYEVLPIFQSQAQVLASTAPTASIFANSAMYPQFMNFSAYAQDAWKVAPRLTLDFGLRWEVNPAPTEAHGNEAVAVDQITNLATTKLAPLGTREWKTRYDNIAPRFGLAYRLSGTNTYETVLRGGIGVFYDTGNDGGALNFNDSYPYSSTRVASNVVFPLSATQVAPAPLPIQSGLTTPYPAFFAFDPNLKLPYTVQWNLALEQSLGKDQALTLSYVGAAARNLLQSVQMRLSPINHAFTTIFLTRNSATSDYDALQAQFQRQLSHGLQALASYSWAHALDDDSSSTTFAVAARGNAAFDIRHVFAGALTYDIPAPYSAPALSPLLGHWSIDTSFRAQSGAPVDLVANTFTNPADGSQVNIRPNVNPGVPFYLSGSACTASNAGLPCPGGRRINPAAFNTNIPAGQSGNLGRNQLRGLGAWQQDLALRREFPVLEHVKVQFRAEAFNLFNHPNFGGLQTLLTASNFGEPTNMLNRQLGGLSALYQIGGPRSFQFALKVLF